MNLLLNGNFTEEQRKELSKEIGFDVFEYITKSVEPQEIVRLLFKDLDAWILIRDGLLYSLLTGTVKKAITWVKNRKSKAIIQTAVELLITKDNSSFSVNLFVPVNDVEVFSLLLKEKFDDNFFETVKNKEIISISLDKDGSLKIIRM